MSSRVFPRVKVRVVIFAADLKQVRVIRKQMCRDTHFAKVMGDRTLPEFNRAPWTPKEIHCAY